MKKENSLYILVSIILCLSFIFIGMQQEVITPSSYIEITLLLILLGRNVSINEDKGITGCGARTDINKFTSIFTVNDQSDL